MHYIFKSFRELGLNHTNQSLIKFHGDDPLIGNGYCFSNNVRGSPLSSIIDGNNLTAYASYPDNKDVQEITVEFVLRPVYIKTLYYTSICGSPANLLIEGSNDNVNYIPIGRRNEPFKDQVTNQIDCFKKKHFKFIKMSQTQNKDGNKRIHIQHLEILGTFDQIPNVTCRKLHFHCSFLIMMLLLAK